MKAKLTTKNYVVWIEPIKGQPLYTLLKKINQIYNKRSLTQGIVEVFDKGILIYRGLA